MVSLITASG